MVQIRFLTLLSLLLGSTLFFSSCDKDDEIPKVKEELALKKSRQAAIEAGFSHAFWAIMDSNITTFIAALFLSILGTGPIKGFAYSLTIGVVSSVFTALFVSRLIFDFGTETLGSKKIRVSWRLNG